MKIFQKGMYQIIILVIGVGINGACINGVFAQVDNDLPVKIEIDLTPALETNLNKIKIVAHVNASNVLFDWYKKGPGELFEDGSSEVYYVLPPNITPKKVEIWTIVTTSDNKKQGIKYVVFKISELLEDIQKKRFERIKATPSSTSTSTSTTSTTTTTTSSTTTTTTTTTSTTTTTTIPILTPTPTPAPTSKVFRERANHGKISDRDRKLTEQSLGVAK